MDIAKMEAIISRKICPKCGLSMVRETEDRVYHCGHSQCGEIFDFSSLSDRMISMLLESISKGRETRGGNTVRPHR